MSTVGSVGNAQSGQAMGVGSVGSVDVNQLTTEGLLLYCQTQLNSLGGEIDRMMEEQLANIKRKDALGTLENAIKSGPPKTPTEVEDLKKAFQDAIDLLPEGSKARQDLESLKETYLGKPANAPPKKNLQWNNNPLSMTYTAPSGLQKELEKVAHEKLAEQSSKITTEQRDNAAATVSQVKQTLSENVEMDMIQLQSLIAKRQTAIQLSTNMMAKIEQGPSMIVQNVR